MIYKYNQTIKELNNKFNKRSEEIKDHRKETNRRKYK